ncbi:FAD:protein FMN transferase [Tateyamaria omphalii]|nr:FAD:protein FMN transferase [Tateyamaria omphalii]
MTASLKLHRRTFLAMTLALAACKNRAHLIEITGLSMGTTYNVVAIDHDGALDKPEVKKAIDVALADITAKLSNWDNRSEITQFNVASTGTPQVMSPELSRVMTAAAQVHQASEGRFDTTIGGLIELWGFGAPGSATVPNSDAIAQALETSGHQNALRLNGDQIAKRNAQAQVYLAGIGKGFGADHIAQVLESFGLTDYMVEIGGDLYTSGRNPDGLAWQIGIEAPNPADRTLAGVVGLSGMGLATSGDYRNYFEVDGQRFSHLIDPATGHPVTHATASATVLADNAMLADAWSTAMHVLGREKGLEIATAQNIAVQFIERRPGVEQPAFDTYVSPRFEALTA